MAYNYPGAPSGYDRTPSYASYPGASGVPPGMAPPPGTSGAPGTQSQQGPGGFPQGFDPQASLPNINFSAPVIRLGMGGQDKSTTSSGADRRGGNAEPLGNRRNAGLGYENRGGQRTEKLENVTLPSQSREEVARTVFVANVTESFGTDEQVRSIFDVVRGFRNWTRALDSNLRPLTFGFAEYDSADSLAIAIEVLKDVQIKSKDQPNKKPKKEPKVNGVKKEEDTAMEDVKTESNTEGTDEDTPVKQDDHASSGQEQKPDPDEMDADGSPVMDEMTVVVDEASKKYITEWRGNKDQKSESDAEARQFLIDGAIEELRQVLRNIENPATNANEDGNPDGDAQGAQTQTVTNAETGEVVEIPINVEDELSDIPAEMRETVTQEIAAFRDRSHQRDLERLKQEEEAEAREKARNAAASVGGGANAIPLGPKSNQPAPSGPRGMTGSQIPRDYQKGVAFVNGGTTNGISGLNQADEDSDASDEELERRRQEKRNAELEKLYLDQERKWMNRERSRQKDIDDHQEKEAAEAARYTRERPLVRDRLKEWDDDKEAHDRREEYYNDRSMWLRNRAIFRQREAALDERDRKLEERERQLEQEQRNKEAGVADAFLDEQAKELEQQLQKPAPRGPVKFKMGLSSAKDKAQSSEQPVRRSVVALEGLLEDDDDQARREKNSRQLMPIAEDASKGSKLSAEERQQAARQLAQEIPSDRRGLWAWEVEWDYVDEGVLAQLREFVEKKISEALGTMDERQVEKVEALIMKRARPQDLVEALRPTLKHDTEDFARKLWRMLIFLSESERRGLGD